MMSRLRPRPTLALLTLVAALSLSACGEAVSPVEPISTTSNSSESAPVFRNDDVLPSDVGPTPTDEMFLEALRPGFLTVAKVATGSTDKFTFNMTASGPGVPTAPLNLSQVMLGDMEWADVYEAPAGLGIGADFVTITEEQLPGYQVDRVFIWNIEEDPNAPYTYITTWMEKPAGTTSIEGYIDEQKTGCVVIFYNSKTPTEEGPGTGTPGYWKTHPEAWPVESITIGGTSYTKEEAINYLWMAERGDKTKTMFRALVCAKLNGLIGNDTSCVDSEIADADAWMMLYPVCSGVRGSSAAWTEGSPLATTLDDYNNGLLCAPHRD